MSPNSTLLVFPEAGIALKKPLIFKKIITKYKEKADFDAHRKCQEQQNLC